MSQASGPFEGTVLYAQAVRGSVWQSQRTDEFRGQLVPDRAGEGASNQIDVVLCHERAKTG